LKTAALTVAGLALALSGLAGCGGDDSDGGGAPTSASKDDFCATFESLEKDMQDLDPSDVDAAIGAIRDAGQKLEDTGTPEDIPDDARAGFDFIVETINGIDDDASIEDLAKIGQDLSDSDEANSKAFDEYLSDTCDV
jgi:hypothetical protein